MPSLLLHPASGITWHWILDAELHWVILNHDLECIYLPRHMTELALHLVLLLSCGLMYFWSGVLCFWFFVIYAVEMLFYGKHFGQLQLFLNVLPNK